MATCRTVDRGPRMALHLRVQDVHGQMHGITAEVSRPEWDHLVNQVVEEYGRVAAARERRRLNPHVTTQTASKGGDAT
jgi:hypothetical protein